MMDWPQGRHIIEEQIETIIDSGIMDHCQLFLYCNYDINNYQWAIDRLKTYKNVHFIDSGAIPEDYEILTLAGLKNSCDADPVESYVLYIHHKGITRPHSEAVRDWRNLMMYFNVTKWRDCVEKLDQGYDTAGVNWRENFPNEYPHYSGNFWWAKSSYIKRLPAFQHPHENGYRPQFRFSGWLHKQDAEFWIGLGQPKSAVLYSSGGYHDHYQLPYPPEIYRK